MVAWTRVANANKVGRELLEGLRGKCFLKELVTLFFKPHSYIRLVTFNHIWNDMWIKTLCHHLQQPDYLVYDTSLYSVETVVNEKDCQIASMNI